MGYLIIIKKALSKYLDRFIHLSNIELVLCYRELCEDENAVIFLQDTLNHFESEGIYKNESITFIILLLVEYYTAKSRNISIIYML